jgi:hypothetical protein
MVDGLPSFGKCEMPSCVAFHIQSRSRCDTSCMDATSLVTAAALLASQGSGDARMFQIETGAQLCKSTTAIEGGQRVLYMEASNQARDVQNETILADALDSSKDYFLKYGRLDLDHATVWQMIREQKMDPSNPYGREIGRPLDVRITRQGNDSKVWVKAAIFKSNSKDNSIVKAADWFWESLQLSPPMAWFPSVAGSLLPGGREQRPDGHRVVKALRWHSIGLSRNPVNPEVGQVSTVPLEVFCKALREGGDISSALSAMSNFGPQSQMPEKPMDRVEGSIQALQSAALITPEQEALIRQAIIDAPPPYKVDDWIIRLIQSGITPAQGMAYLLAVLDGGHQLALS